jgi:geranylgeranyl pyrophosphate synthase
MPNIATLLEDERRVVESALDRWLPAPGEYPERIHEAIRYSALNGGKRLRPIIALAATRALGFDDREIVKSSCAVEYVHCCSLVLDDLPSMDNAMMRRGRPTTHRAFGTATAILAADALLMHAFKLVAENGVDAGASGPSIARAITDLATAVGSFGMVGGQHVDLEVAGRDTIDAATLEYIQSRKTGSLFVARTSGRTWERTRSLRSTGRRPRAGPRRGSRRSPRTPSGTSGGIRWCSPASRTTASIEFPDSLRGGALCGMWSSWRVGPVIGSGR